MNKKNEAFNHLDRTIDRVLLPPCVEDGSSPFNPTQKVKGLVLSTHHHEVMTQPTNHRKAMTQLEM